MYKIEITVIMKPCKSLVLLFPTRSCMSSSLLSLVWLTCSGALNRQTRLRTGIIIWDQPDINHPPFKRAQVIAF